MTPLRDLPLALDLDGTLLRTDAVWETLISYCSTRPLRWGQVAAIAVRGRAPAKRFLAMQPGYDVAAWPVREELRAYAEAEAKRGRLVALATASDRLIAEAVQAQHSFISEIIASDGRRTIKGAAKGAALAARFPMGFVYAGDSWADLAVWRRARGAILAGVSPRLRRAAARLAPIEAEFA